MIHRQLSTAQTAVTTAEAQRGQHRALIDNEAQTRRDLEELLAEARGCLDDHSFLLSSSQDMLSFDLNRVLND